MVVAVAIHQPYTTHTFQQPHTMELLDFNVTAHQAILVIYVKYVKIYHLFKIILYVPK